MSDDGTFEDDVFSVASESLVEDSLSLLESRINLTLGMFDRLNDTIQIIASNTGSLESELTSGRKSPVQKMFKSITKEFSQILQDMGDTMLLSSDRFQDLKDELNDFNDRNELQNRN